MRDGPSRTAEATCLFRALETRRPGAQRVLHDPFARHFLTVSGRAALGLGHPVLADAADSVASGLSTFVILRHRFIDDALREALAASGDARVEQVVLLGAGYDTRAWRFADALGDRPVIEIDHPATSARKARIVAEHGAHWPAVDRRVVAADLQRETLAHALARGGYHPERPAFVAWEGVSMYLSAPAVDATLEVLAAGAAGTTVALDLWDPRDLGGMTGTLRGLGLRTLALLGEPVTFGLPPDDAARFFARLGWSLVDQAGPDDLAARFLPEPRPVYPTMWCATLRVS